MRLPAYLTENPQFFGGRRWVFWSIGLLPAVMLLLSKPCGTNENWLATMLLPVMVMACFWEAHVQALSLNPTNRVRLLLRVCKRALRTLLFLAVAALLSSVLVGIFLPAYQCYTQRARVAAAIVSGTAELRSEIDRRASATKTLKGTGLALKLPKGQGKQNLNGFILEDGAIVLVIEQPPAALLFTPRLLDMNSGVVQWSCRGFPEKSVPAECHDPE